MAPRRSKVEPVSWRKISENTKQVTNQIEWIQKTKSKIRRATESLSSLTNMNIDDNYKEMDESPARNTRSNRRQSLAASSPIHMNPSKKAIRKMKSLTRVTGEAIRQRLGLKSAHLEFANSPETPKVSKIPICSSPRTPHRIRMGTRATPSSGGRRVHTGASTPRRCATAAPHTSSSSSDVCSLTLGLQALTSNCDLLTTPKSIRIRTTPGGRRRKIIT